MPRTIAYRAGGFTNYGISYTKFSQEELAEMKERAMTENEAIEELKYDCNELGKAIPCDTSWGKSFENAYAMAIKALEEVQQYRKIGTPEECRAAVEKQTAKKVEIWNDGSEHCPCCDKNNSYLGFKVCIECGQLLDWNEET